MAKFTEIKNIKLRLTASGVEYTVMMEDGTEKVLTKEQFDLTNDKLIELWGLDKDMIIGEENAVK